MKRGIRAALGGLGIAGAIGLAVAPTLAAGAGPAPRVRLGGPPAVSARAADVGGLAPGALIHFTVALKPRTGLASFVCQVSDPASPHYRPYLAPPQFGQRFGAIPAPFAALGASARGRRPPPAH